MNGRATPTRVRAPGPAQPDRTADRSTEPQDATFGALDAAARRARPDAETPPPPEAGRLAGDPATIVMEPLQVTGSAPDAGTIVMDPLAVTASAPAAARRALAAHVAATAGNAAAGRAPGAAPAAAGSEPEDATFGAREAPAPAGGAHSGARPPPLSPGEVEARVAGAVAGIPHPTAPTAAGARARLDGAGGAIAARGEARTLSMVTAPRQLVARPGRRRVPRPDPGPIPAQMAVVRAKTNLPLPAATLPPLTPTPRGTMPDISGPIVSERDLTVARLGELAIGLLVSGTDPIGLDEQERLKTLLRTLGGRTHDDPPPEPVTVAPVLSNAGVEIVDEPVAGVGVTPEQRALFTNVVGQLRGNTEAESRLILKAVRQNDAAYPGGALDRAFDEPPQLGDDLAAGIADALSAEANDLAGAIGLAPDQIDAAISGRQTELEQLRTQAREATSAAATKAVGTAAATDARTRATAAAAATATARAVAADRAVARPVSATQARVQRTLDELREPIATELARYDTQLRQRERAIADAVRRQASAIRVARTRDEIAIEAPEGPSTREERLEVAHVNRWANAEIAALEEGPTSAAATLVAAARAQTETFKSELRIAASDAFAALRTWGSENTKATDTWWTTMDADLERWATDATARAQLWQGAQDHVSRLALAQDLAAVERIVALQRANDHEAARAYMEGLDGEARSVVTEFMTSVNGGAPDTAGALTAGIRDRVRAARRDDLERELELAVQRLDPWQERDWAAMDRLLKVVQPNWDIADKASKLHEAVTHWNGHDEEAIFAALGALSPIAAKMLPVYYEWAYGQSLDDALRGRGHAGYLTGDEMRTARELLASDRVSGAVGAINSALSGWGAEMAAVKRILRALTPEERVQVRAAYEARYGVTLAADLDDQWSVTPSHQAEALAIADNDLRGADAIALARAVQTHHVADEGGLGERNATVDRDQASAVYAQIRGEVEAEGARRHWVTSQIEAEITLRNQELEETFNERSGNKWWAQGQAEGTSALRTAFALSRGPGRDLLEGMADNDLARVDVARLQLEDRGLYAEDTAINGVFRDQSARSLAEVNRDLGPILSSRAEARLSDEEARGAFRTEEERVDRRMELERENARELTGIANDRTRARTDHLGTLYRERSGRSLAQMVEANMSGTTRAEARAHMESGGVLTPYQRLRFSIEGLGTDMPALRSTISAMSSEELREADERWRREHDRESLYEAIIRDTSGRERGDLLDAAVHGAPETAADVVAAARRRFDRDRADETGVGAALTSHELAAATHEIQGLESALAELRRPGLSPDARWRASTSFDIAVERANTTIDLQRRAVDAVTDTLANAAAITTAVVVGVALSPFTGGGSAVVAAAIITSLAATAASMAVKAMVKGGAYGHEEVYTDLAVGTVDALVAALTAGMGNALLGGPLRGVSPVARSAMYRGLSRMGGIGAGAARAQARVAGFMAKAGTQGVLVRGLEQRALLGGLANSKHLANRLIAKAASEIIEQGVQAVPSTLAASLLDERVYRQPGGALSVLHNTLAGTLHSTVMGLGMAGAHSVGSHAAQLGASGLRSITDGFRAMVPPEIRMPTGDVLAHMGTPSERLSDFRAWRAQHPEGSVREFNTARRAEAIERWQLGDAQRERTRAAREQLLAELPAHERGMYADVPIRSVSDAEFTRLSSSQTTDAHLLVVDGQAVVLLRDGASPSAARALLPELRERVFAGSSGMTLEGALPPRLRDVAVRIDTTLATDEVRVKPIPPGDGPITGVEVVIGPNANPMDVALHAGEVARVRGWTGRVGEARMALARHAERVGLRLDSPADRARFEAAGELRKLGPIIEERIRRTAAAAGDSHATARLEAEVRHLLAQQERARRIVDGELVAEPRGYVAAKGLPAAPPHAEADAAAAGATALVPPPSAADRATLARANSIAAQIGDLQRSFKVHRTAIGDAEFIIATAAREIHAEVVRSEKLSSRAFGGPGAFSQRCVASPHELAAALERLPAGAKADAIRRRIADAPAKIAMSSGHLAKLEGRVAALRAELASLGDLVALRANQNQHLDYAAILNGPDGVCLPPETLVATPGGPVAIADVRAGSEVLAADAASGATRTARVVGRLDGWTDWLVEIVAGGETLRATRSHRLAVAGTSRWLAARLVVPGTRLVSLDGEDRTVDSVRLVQCATATCNLEVAELHCYYAGPCGVLVHNGEASRVFSSDAVWEGEVYRVKRRVNGEWVVVYVGSANGVGLTFERFEGHLQDAREGDVRKAAWLSTWEKVGKAGETVVDTEQAKFKQRGDVMVDVIARGQFTDLALAIVEQAHIAAHERPGPLVNIDDAISAKAFEKYYTRERRAHHSPCR